MKIFLVRHGRTLENESGTIQGHLPGKLSDEGLRQAEKAAIKLQNEHFDAIYSSDLSRAAETAKSIAKFHSDTPVKFVEDLRERHMGEFQGKRKSDLGFETKDSLVVALDTKEGETIPELYLRARKFLDDLTSKHQGQTVLLVGHNGINKALISALFNLGYEDIISQDNHGNTSISIFEIDKNNNAKTILMNSTEHLD